LGGSRRGFRDDVARDSDMMSPGRGASLADNFWHLVGRSVNPWLACWYGIGASCGWLRRLTFAFRRHA
jgi:hypothetical protein